MDKYFDIVIVGAATTGSYFAKNMAERGHSVLVIEKSAAHETGGKYDIFHIPKEDFDRFNLPLPEKGEDYAFSYETAQAYSAYGRYPKTTKQPTIGMHMQKYTARLNKWAINAGAEILYEADFKQLTYQDGKISGVQYEKDGKTHTVKAAIVADCSGIRSVVRTTLPKDYGVENFEISPNDMFYVILRYVKYKNPEDYVDKIRTWTYFKTWEAPEADPQGGIIGVGANISFEYAETMFNKFQHSVRLPEYSVKYKEKGVTPYRRPPYSFVADGFIVAGDSACLTKPHAGEGVSSSMVLVDAAVEVIDSLLKQKMLLSKENLWNINKVYIQKQGKAYAASLATLVGAVATNANENNFFFEKDIIFSKKTFENMEQGVEFSTKEMLSMAFTMLTGVLSRRLRISTISALLKSMKNGTLIKNHYNNFPDSPDGFDEWCKKADELWERCGSMAEHIKTA